MGKESQLSVLRFNCAQTPRDSRHFLLSSRAELAPGLGEVCGFLPRPTPATCGAVQPPRPLARARSLRRVGQSPNTPAPRPHRTLRVQHHGGHVLRERARAPAGRWLVERSDHVVRSR